LNLDERHIPSLMVGTNHKEEGIKEKWTYLNFNHGIMKIKQNI
jgi:hypothetical protein